MVLTRHKALIGARRPGSSYRTPCPQTADSSQPPSRQSPSSQPARLGPRWSARCRSRPPTARSSSSSRPCPWTAVKGADKYQFQISADAGMNSPVLGDGQGQLLHPQHARDARQRRSRTGPTTGGCARLTPPARSRPGPQPRSFRKQWNLQPALQSPSSGASLSFPANPVVLSWSGVRRARRTTWSRSRATRPSARSSSSTPTRTIRKARRTSPPTPPRSPRRWRRARTTGASTPVDAEGNRGVVHAGRLVQLAVAVDDGDASRGPEPGAGGLRPALLLGPGSRRSPLRGRDQLVLRLRARLEGLLQRDEHRDLALADAGLQGQRLLLARPRARPGRQRRRLEPGPVVHQDLRQGRAGRPRHRHEHQEPAHARQPRRPGHRRRRRDRRLPDRGPGRHAGTRFRARRATRSRSSRMTGRPATGLTPSRTSRRRRSRSGRRSARPQPGQPRHLAGDARRGQRLSTLVAGRPTASACALAATAPPAIRRSGATTPTCRTAARTRRRRSAQPSPGRTTRTRPIRRRRAVLHSGYLCCARLPAPAHRHDDRADDPLFTWKALAGANSYFVVVAKDPNFSNVVDEGFTQHPGVRAAQLPQADDVHRRDDDLLLGGSAADARRRNRRAADRPTAPPSGSLPEAVDASDPALAEQRPGLLRPADLPLDADARRTALPDPGRRPTRPSATRSTTSSPTRPPTRATRPTRRTRCSTGASAPTTRTSPA